MADSQLLEKIRNQIEFYFSDSNYPKDKFLRAQAALNDDGYVALSVVSSFSRMKTLTTDMKAIQEALKTSELLKMNSDETMVKRVAPIPEEDTSAPRTIYARGFPSTEGYTIDDVEKVFKPLGKVLCVRIRKALDKSLKPSVFVEFSSEEEAKAAIAAKPKFKDTELTVMMKADYFNKKKEERKQKVQEKKAKRKAVSDEGAEGEEKQDKKKQKKGEKKEHEPKPYAGTIMTFKGVGENLTRETLKELFGEFGTVAFVDFSSGSSEGAIRFDTADTAKQALEKLQAAKKEIGGKVPELQILPEAEEKAYWDKVHSKGFGGKKKGGPRRKRY